MNYERINMGAYNLHIIKTDKFKTNVVDINFRRPITQEDLTYRNLLKMVLLNSSYDYPTERALTIETEELYDLKLYSTISRLGNYSNLSFKLKFLDEKYTEYKMNKKSIELLLDVVFKPNIKDGHFKEDVVELCKKRLANDIKSIKDNKIKYARLKLLSSIKDKPYTYTGYGDLEILEEIDGTKLYEYYKNFVSNDQIDVFMVGQASSTTLKDCLKEYICARTFLKNPKPIFVEEITPVKKVIYLKEQDDVNQSQLAILFSAHGLTDEDRMYIGPVFNELLGGSSNSILFNTVREDNSYCYYVNSNLNSVDNFMVVYSGIAHGCEKEVTELVKKSLINIEKGKFDDNALEASKKTIIGAITASLDNQNSLITMYYNHLLIGTLLPEERIKMIKKVTKNDIIYLAKKLKMHTVFTLEGDEEDATENA